MTPEMFIKFLSMLRVLYKNKIEEISAKQNRYQQVMEKLNFTANQVSRVDSTVVKFHQKSSDGTILRVPIGDIDAS